MLAVGGVAGLVVFASPNLFECDNDKVVETFSPNGQFKAVTFRRNCGATTSYSTHVSILPASSKLPNEAGNVFIAKHEPAITLRWIDDRHLSVTAEKESPFLQVADFEGIRITYE
jgi:hypothetical protein